MRAFCFIFFCLLSTWSGRAQLVNSQTSNSIVNGFTTNYFISGFGSGDIGALRYTGRYTTLNITFTIPTLATGSFFSEGSFTLDYGVNRGTFYQYSYLDNIKVSLGGTQPVIWNIGSYDAYQSHQFSLSTDQLNTLSSFAGNTFTAEISLVPHSGFDPYDSVAKATIDSSQLDITAVPEPSPLVYFITMIMFLMISMTFFKRINLRTDNE